MKVYRIDEDVNHYQYLLPADASVWSTDRLTFDGTPKAEHWVPPEVYVHKPKLKRGNFFGGIVGCLLHDGTAHEKLADLFAAAGEMLPLPHEGQMFHILNVTECINALNQQHTQWRASGGVKISIEKYVFHPNRIGESTLFKIPETCRGEVLVAERTGDPEDEFKRGWKSWA